MMSTSEDDVKVEQVILRISILRKSEKCKIADIYIYYLTVFLRLHQVSHS